MHEGPQSRQEVGARAGLIVTTSWLRQRGSLSSPDLGSSYNQIYARKCGCQGICPAHLPRHLPGGLDQTLGQGWGSAPTVLHHPIYIPTHCTAWYPWMPCCASGNFLSSKLSSSLWCPLIPETGPWYLSQGKTCKISALLYQTSDF